MSAGSCVHISTYKQNKDVLSSYEILHAFYVSCIAQDSLGRKSKDCQCHIENCDENFQRIHACLTCIYFGCFLKGHIQEHAKKENHLLAIDTNYGHVYCFACQDYKYDADFEKVSQKHWTIAALKRGSVARYTSRQQLDDAIISQHQFVNVSESIGVKGLVNMGNTCYLSVIIHSVIHAPVLRDYFLSLEHCCVFASPEESTCIACAVSDIIQEFFSGEEMYVVPYYLLYLLWYHDKYMRGNEQQDAHQCYLSLLHCLHISFTESSAHSPHNELSCKCIIDTIFTGLFEYHYTCTECKYLTVKKETFRDIQVKYSTSVYPGSCDILSFDDCLKKTMQTICIPNYECSQCRKQVDCSFQMTLKKVPIVISFYIGQSSADRPTHWISYPEFLDLSPYMKLKNGMVGSLKYRFYLYAVVKHLPPKSKRETAADGGHYTCYIRQCNQKWFYCDDDVVRPASVKEVLNQQVYLLFYHRQYLYDK